MLRRNQSVFFESPARDPVMLYTGLALSMSESANIALVTYSQVLSRKLTNARCLLTKYVLNG